MADSSPIGSSTSLPTLRTDNLRPYISLTILQITSANPFDAFAQLMMALKEMSVIGRNSHRVVVAEGLDASFLVDRPDGDLPLNDGYQFDALVVRSEQYPSWIKADSDFIDVDHDLVVCFRRNRVIGVRCPSATARDQLQRWLDTPPLPPLSRIPEGVLHAAFLKGEAKGLWLKGTHVRKATKADAKNLSGKRLQDALLPHEDGTFAMGSARALLPSNLGLASLTGTVGTTPRKSLAWGGATTDVMDFFRKSDEMLMLVEDALAAGVEIDQPFPLLAVAEDDLAQVHDAFDFTVLHPDDLRESADVSDDMLSAAELLQHGIIRIHGRSDSPSFKLDVGIDNAIGGTLRGRVVPGRGQIDFRFGLDPSSNPTNEPATRDVLEALEHYAGDLLTVYYESGHTIVQRGIYKRSNHPAPFPNWDFRDFAGYDICKEKPAGSIPQDIHDAIGLRPDNSLFGWVVQNYSTGWLICDDGSGEVADFVHIATDTGELSLIHVKSAKSSAAKRQIAVGPYEVVASQAAKNVRYLSTGDLLGRLRVSPVGRPASWVDGERVGDRSQFLEMLQARSARDLAKIVIVQPHVNEDLHKRASHERETEISNNHNVLRLTLLEALLNSARASVVGLGGDLYVVGSLQ